MIDTHSHMLPGLDDGSPDMSHSLRMAEAAAAAGVTTVVCTPHLRDFDVSLIARAREVLEEFRSELESGGIALKLLLGFEVDVSVAATASDDELRLLTVESSYNLLLVEMPHWGWPMHLLDTIFRLRTTGLTPVLAHPERNDRIQRSPGLLGECLDAGAVAQATAASLDGGFGRASRTAFSRQLSLGHIGVLASDAHAHRHSSWTVASVTASLRRRLSEEDVDLLVRVNPARLLSGEPPLPVTAARLSAWRGLTGGL
jgi:protein-tyrosine phosphatase